MKEVAEPCRCGLDDCSNLAAGFPYCRAHCCHHRGEECPIDEDGKPAPSDPLVEYLVIMDEHMAELLGAHNLPPHLFALREDWKARHFYEHYSQPGSRTGRFSTRMPPDTQQRRRDETYENPDILDAMRYAWGTVPESPVGHDSTHTMKGLPPPVNLQIEPTHVDPD
jgi:hypothetical protein